MKHINRQSRTRLRLDVGAQANAQSQRRIHFSVGRRRRVRSLTAGQPGLRSRSMSSPASRRSKQRPTARMVPSIIGTTNITSCVTQKPVDQCAAKAAARRIGPTLGAGRSSTRVARSSIRIAMLSGLTFAINELAIRFAASFATLISTLSRSSKSTINVWPRYSRCRSCRSFEGKRRTSITSKSDRFIARAASVKRSSAEGSITSSIRFITFLNTR